MIINVGKDIEGLTVKKYLYNTLSLSSNIVKRLKSMPDGICVNGEHKTVRHVLSQGEILSLALEDRDDEVNENISPADIPIDIIYEDDDIIAVNKPFNMPTHPSHNHHDDTLANALVNYYIKRKRPFVFRAVNRLDSDTSGIVLIAKNKSAAYFLGKQMSGGNIKKEYIALLHGKLTQNKTIDIPIRRANDSTMLRIADAYSPLSKQAVTEYKVLANFDNSTLVLAMPITGRTHQLRVHFSRIGHPIYGDGLYGITADGSDFQRLALHAYSLAFNHPSKGKLTLYAELDDTHPEFNSKFPKQT